MVMRIKKKHVLLEALLVDVSHEFGTTEKRILKLLNREYGNPYGFGNNFNQWEVGAWLIETLEIPYEMAYELTKTYYLNYDKLFSEIESIRKRISTSQLFFENLSKFRDNFKTEIGETYGTVNVKFKKDKIVEPEREVHLWGRFDGITLYIPLNLWEEIDRRYTTTEERGDRLILIDAIFKPFDKNGNVVTDSWISPERYEESFDDEYFSVNVSYRIGQDSENKKDLMKIKVKYPKPLTKVTYYEMVKNIIDKIKLKINNTKFDLPIGVTPLV
jgi:hypothetical protein